MTHHLAAALGAALLAATTASAAPGAAQGREMACQGWFEMAGVVMTHRQAGGPRAAADAIASEIDAELRPQLDRIIDAAWATAPGDPEAHEDIVYYFAEEIFATCMNG